jgi:hypothetical protein
MDYEKVILDFFYTGYGIIAHPKTDNRVEVPQSFVKTMGWNHHKKLYMSYDDGAEFYISYDPQFHSEDEVQIEVSVSNRRVRIPAGFLKKIGMDGRALSFIGADDLGIVRIDNSHNENEIGGFIASLDVEDVEELGRLLVGRDVAFEIEEDDEIEIPDEEKEAKIPFGEIARVSVKKNANLILLSKSESVVFRPIQNPYKFTGHWDDKEIVFSRNVSKDTKQFKFYLIPGIQRVKQEKGGFVLGFLLLDENIFGKVCERIVRSPGRKTAVGVEMIFIHDSFTFGSFKVYENPPEELPCEVLERAKFTCSDPEGFLSKAFRIVDSPSKNSNPPLSVNSTTVELHGN